MTARKAPQDHLPKIVSGADSDEGLVMQIEWEGISLTGHGDNVTGETMEYLSQGMIHFFIKDLFGAESWEGSREKKIVGLKTFPLRKLKDLIKAWGDASKAAGNS